MSLSQAELYGAFGLHIPPLWGPSLDASYGKGSPFLAQTFSERSGFSTQNSSDFQPCVALFSTVNSDHGVVYIQGI